MEQNHPSSESTTASAKTPVPTREAATGIAAERLARRYLEARGLRYLEQNFTRRVGEIDLVMHDRDSGCIVFVEVRFRDSDVCGGALQSLDRAKQRRLERAARSWLQRHGDDRVPARIDLLAIRPDRSQMAASPLPGELIDEVWEAHRVLWVQNAIDT